MPALYGAALSSGEGAEPVRSQNSVTSASVLSSRCRSQSSAELVELCVLGNAVPPGALCCVARAPPGDRGHSSAWTPEFSVCAQRCVNETAGPAAWSLFRRCSVTPVGVRVCVGTPPRPGSPARGLAVPPAVLSGLCRARPALGPASRACTLGPRAAEPGRASVAGGVSTRPPRCQRAAAHAAGAPPRRVVECLPPSGSASLPRWPLSAVMERIVTASDLLSVPSKERSIFLPLSFLKADMAICLNCCLEKFRRLYIFPFLPFFFLLI